jgi:hypothetical protein
MSVTPQGSLRQITLWSDEDVKNVVVPVVAVDAPVPDRMGAAEGEGAAQGIDHCESINFIHW